MSQQTTYSGVIPPSLRRFLFRAYLTPLALVFIAFGLNFIFGQLSVKAYGGIYTQPWLWGPLFIASGLLTFIAAAQVYRVYMVSLALACAVMSSGMWLMVALITSLAAHINYVSPFIWLYILWSNILAIIALRLMNPRPITPVRRKGDGP